jgi:hypothetical protein
MKQGAIIETACDAREQFPKVFIRTPLPLVATSGVRKQAYLHGLGITVVCWFKRMGSITPQEGLVYRRISRFEEARFDRSWTTCPTSTKYRYSGFQ